MGDYAKKPKNYKRGRCLEFERICREEREAGATVVVVKPCQRSFPCLADIMVLAGLEQPCTACTPNVQRAREAHDFERHPATHGTFYTSKHITAEQQELIQHRIGQADVRNWINEKDYLEKA